MEYGTDQTTVDVSVGTVHKTILIYVVQLSVLVWCWIYFTPDQHTAMLHTSIGIGIGLGTGIARDQNYWILDIGCLAWYRSNPKQLIS